MKTLSYSEALREAFAEEMKRDARVFLLGEDIGAYGGAFGVTRGLLGMFGPTRVIDSPISEQSFVGVAIGAALAGFRPVVEIMFMDFIALAMDQILNQAAKLRYVFGAQARCPLVIRTAAGGGRCYGPTHSQTLESLFMAVPGLKIAVPATPADAKGLLKTAIRDDNPVLFVENKLLYPTRGEVPAIQNWRLPFGRARIVARGSDVTIIAWSRMALEAVKAAEQLAGQGISAEVLDLRTLRPMDEQAIFRSVRKTHRVVIVEEGVRTGGVAAEIAARIFEKKHYYLDAPIIRVTAPDSPIPASPVLEAAALPDAQKIVAAVRGLLKE